MWCKDRIDSFLGFICRPLVLTVMSLPHATLASPLSLTINVTVRRNSPIYFYGTTHSQVPKCSIAPTRARNVPLPLLVLWKSTRLLVTEYATDLPPKIQHFCTNFAIRLLLEEHKSSPHMAFAVNHSGTIGIKHETNKAFIKVLHNSEYPCC